MYAIRSYYVLLICIIGIIPGVSLGETSSMVIENGHQSVIADFRGDIVITSYSIHYTKLYEVTLNDTE